MPLIMLFSLFASITSVAAQCSCPTSSCNTQKSLSAGSSFSVYKTCNSGYIARVDKLNVASTDSSAFTGQSAFTVYTKATETSSSYYTAASFTNANTCVNMAADKSVGSSSSVYVTIECQNSAFSCPLIYDIEIYCYYDSSPTSKPPTSPTPKPASPTSTPPGPNVPTSSCGLDAVLPNVCSSDASCLGFSCRDTFILSYDVGFSVSFDPCVTPVVLNVAASVDNYRWAKEIPVGADGYLNFPVTGVSVGSWGGLYITGSNLIADKSASTLSGTVGLKACAGSSCHTLFVTQPIFMTFAKSCPISPGTSAHPGLVLAIILAVAQMWASRV